MKHWIEVLEKMYVIFLVRPYSKNLARAILKPPKIYFFDNGDIDGDEGAKFENLVATHLLKMVHYLEDRDGFRYELRYVRDKEGREADFLILKDNRPLELLCRENRCFKSNPSGGSAIAELFARKASRRFGDRDPGFY